MYFIIIVNFEVKRLISLYNDVTINVGLSVSNK